MCNSMDFDSGSEYSSTGSRRGSVVSFGDIRVREFERIAGDHPDVSDLGPPLAIGWGYYEIDAMPIDDYESIRCYHRHPKLEKLPAETRRIILQYGFCIPMEEICAKQREAMRAKQRREETVRRQGTITEKFEVAFLRARRTLHI